MLALPGSAYLYQGEELGLPEAIDLPDAARQDPTWFRTNGERYGRDGCRVPIPWEADGAVVRLRPGRGELAAPARRLGVVRARRPAGRAPARRSRMYEEALAARRAHDLAFGALEWLSLGDDVLAFRNGNVTVVANLGADAGRRCPAGEVLLASGALDDGALPQDVTVWLATN